MLALVVVLSGCATTTSNPYPYFEKLSIEALQPPAAEETDALTSTGKAMAVGATAGATGALATGLLVSLACGPYFALCFAGTGAAALGGATVGAIMAGSTALSAEDAEKVLDRLEGLQGERNLSDDLVRAVSASLPVERLALPESADAHLGLEVQGLRVAPGFGDTVSIWVATKASLEWTSGNAEKQETSRGFACRSEPLPLEDWLNADKMDAEQGLSHCIDDLALQLQTALQSPGTDPDADYGPPVGFGNYDPASDEW